MSYEFQFYQEKDFDEIADIIFSSYQWDYPIFGLSRYEFSRGLHPEFTGIFRAWERTAGVFRDNGKIAACAISEANEESNVFFLFDSKQRAQEPELLKEMIFFAKTTMSSVLESKTTLYTELRVPTWNKVLTELAKACGFQETEGKEKINILPFPSQGFEVALPEGYQFADGRTTPDFYLSNTHMASFNYGLGSVKNCERAFHDLRQMKHYRPELDLCILDPHNRPVAMAIIWYDEKMPYCELEPLGVAWWERRKHLGTAILHEASNRVIRLYPDCRGMTGGDQPFYEKIGYVTQAEIPVFRWETEIYPSWDSRSVDRDYTKDL